MDATKTPCQITSLGQLQEQGYAHRTVKTELCDNLVQRLRAGQAVFADLVGYEDTVVPELINGILAQHDILLLGLRGQAKTRILRSLPQLLDEWIPVVDEVEIWDDPFQPQFSATKNLIEERGDKTPIRWLHRSDRYHEKLATPDVTIADLIGEVDLVKHAEGRHLADESTMHFGMVPRSNRGIFAINELPDLSPRIQVGLFNVLEERDVQIRGYPIRLSLDVLLVFSANPEDYTNRGRIVTPLKDRIGTVVRTHYPLDNANAMAISRSNALLKRPEGAPQVELPPYVHEIVEEMIRLARNSPHINQQSGVSVRASITALEVVVANAERRAIVAGESVIVPRVSDLEEIHAACRGKIELMLAEDDATEDKLIRALVGEAVKNVWEQHFELDIATAIAEAFLGGQTNIEVGDEVPAEQVVAAAQKIKGLTETATGLLKRFEISADSAPHLASAIEFVLEGLHVNDKLSKYRFRERTFYKQ